MKEKLFFSDFCCDIPNCRGLSFVEIYVSDENNHYWSYLCLPHFILAQIFKHEFGWCLADWLFRIPFISKIWNWWVKQ